MKDINDLMEGARTVISVCASVKPKENVLILTEEDVDLDISYALMRAAQEAEANVSICIIGKRSHSGEDPPSQVVSAMKSSDVVIAPTPTTMFYTESRSDACANGARFLSMTGATRNLLKSNALKVDFRTLKPTVRRFADFVTKANEIRFLTQSGTDIRASIEGRRGFPFTSIVENPGEAMGVPLIEVSVAPIENTVMGTIIVDGSISGLGIITKPIRILVKKGKAIKIEGGDQASELRNMLEQSGDMNSYVIAEFGIGLNPKAEITGSIIEDEGALGTVHIAFGNNKSIGGENYAKIHVDMVQRNPIVELDGEIVLKGRQISF